MSLLVYLNQWRRLYKKSANTSALASGNISIQCHHLLFKSVLSAIQKVGQYVGISIGIGLGLGLGEYQCTRFPLVIWISSVGYTKNWPIRRHRHRHQPRGISMYKVSISYLNQQRWLYKKSANTSASALGNISIQCHRLLFKSAVLAIQKIGQYVSIGLRKYQYTMSPFVI